MNAFDWTKPLDPRPGHEPSKFRFSFDVRRLAASLRELADDVESGKVLVFDVATSNQVLRDDWTKTVLTISLSGDHPEAP